MRASILSLLLVTCILQAGKIYNPIALRDEIINYYRSVRHFWLENCWTEQQYKDAIGPLIESYLFLDRHFDQFIGNGYSKKKLNKYIKRVHDLYKQIINWSEGSYEDIDLEDEEEEYSTTSDTINTPSYQNFSGDEFDYENQDNYWNWMNIESQ